MKQKLRLQMEKRPGLKLIKKSKTKRKINVQIKKKKTKKKINNINQKYNRIIFYQLIIIIKKN